MAGVPNNIIIPWVGIEFDSTRAVSGSAEVPITALVIAQKTATGTATVDTKILTTNADQVFEDGGPGSQAHRMAIKWFKNNPTTTTYFVYQDDAATSTAATQTITMGGTATKVGEMASYCSGDRIATSVAVDDTGDDVAAAMVIDINADTNLPFTAAFSTPTLTLTAKNKGIQAGDFDFRFNYNDGEVIPKGITAVINAHTPGTVDPDVQDILDIIGDDWFNVHAHSYIDSTNLDLIEDFALAQAGPMVQRDGMWYSMKRDTRANMITFGEGVARNNQYVSVGPAWKRMESTGELAAGYAAQVAKSIEDDPAVPLHRMTLAGFSAIDPNDRWTAIERNQLAKAGIMTFTDTNGVQSESTVTMYLKNSTGAADTAYQFQNTVFILMRLRYTFVNRILTRYPRAKLGGDTKRLRSGQQVMNVAVGETEALSWFLLEEEAGQVENFTQFKNELVVQRDATNNNRINWLLPNDLMNQFIVGSGVNQFLLEA